MLTRLRLCAVVVAVAAVMVPAGGSASRPAPPKPLLVGWHDEFITLDAWAPWTAGGGADIMRGDVGKLTVVLGKTSMYMAVFKHYRAGVFSDFDVDLDHYPVLAIRVLRLTNASEWDAQVLQYRADGAPDARDISKRGGVPTPGNAARLAEDEVARTGGKSEPGMVFVTVKARPSDVGRKHVRLLLNLSGPRQQGYAEFAWVRFIRQSDVVRVRAHPNLDNIQPGN